MFINGTINLRLIYFYLPFIKINSTIKLVFRTHLLHFLHSMNLLKVRKTIYKVWKIWLMKFILSSLKTSTNKSLFYQCPGSWGPEFACAFFGFNIIKVPNAVSVVYFTIFLTAAFLLIPSENCLFSFVFILVYLYLFSK